MVNNHGYEVPYWGCSPYKWPKWFINGGYKPLTNCDDPPSTSSQWGYNPINGLINGWLGVITPINGVNGVISPYQRWISGDVSHTSPASLPGLKQIYKQIPFEIWRIKTNPKKTSTSHIGSWKQAAPSSRGWSTPRESPLSQLSRCSRATGTRCTRGVSWFQKNLWEQVMLWPDVLPHLKLWIS